MGDTFQEIRKLPNLLDYLFVFVTVFEEGSLSAAARKLNRAVSSISYTIKQLEAQAGTALLLRSTPQVELTEQGRAILAEARVVVEQSLRLSQHMRALESGQEPRLRILVDVLFPHRALIEVLRRFAETGTRVQLQVFHASLNSMWDEMRSGDFDFAIALSGHVPLDMSSREIGQVILSTYCAASHPLARLGRPLTEADYQNARQIYFVARPDISVERVGRVFSTDIWTVDDIETHRQMVVSGLGWSFGTPLTFAEEIADGRVVALASSSPNMSALRKVSLVVRKSRSLGILGNRLADIILGVVRETQPHGPGY